MIEELKPYRDEINKKFNELLDARRQRRKFELDNHFKFEMSKLNQLSEQDRRELWDEYHLLVDQGSIAQHALNESNMEYHEAYTLLSNEYNEEFNKVNDKIITRQEKYLEGLQKLTE